MSCIFLVRQTSIIKWGLLKNIVFLSQLIMFNYFLYLFVCVIQLLWSFCDSQLEEAEMRPFHLTHAIPGASRSLDYDCQSTLEESRLANSMISITWDWRTLCWATFLKFLQLVELCIDEWWIETLLKSINYVYPLIYGTWISRSLCILMLSLLCVYACYSISVA